MPCLRCSAERIVSGSGLVLPALRRKLPLARVSQKWRSLVMPGILAGSVFLVFHDSRLMYMLVPAWLVAAFRMGVSAHQHLQEEVDTDGEVTAEDPEGGRFQQQPQEERQVPVAIPRQREAEGQEVRMPKECPACSSDLAGEVNGRPVVDDLSVVIPEVYPGGLFWRCPFCTHDWHKWGDPIMRKLAAPYMNQPVSST